MSLTNAFETETLEWLFTTTGVTRPTAWYVGLYTVAPTDSGGGTEVSGFDYARVSVTLSVTGDTATNGSALEWATATGTWGTVVAVGIFDAAAAGNLIAYGNLTTSKTITTGDVFRISTGNLDITLD
jgi:hypothetical protein